MTLKKVIWIEIPREFKKFIDFESLEKLARVQLQGASKSGFEKCMRDIKTGRVILKTDGSDILVLINPDNTESLTTLFLGERLNERD